MKFQSSFLLGSILIIIVCHVSHAVLHEGLYLIQSQEDGYILESNNKIVPKTNNENQIRTAPMQNGYNGQRWNLIALGSNKFALVNELNPNNEIGKADHGEEGYPEWAHISLIPVSGGDIFLIRKVRFSSHRGHGRLQNACILNQGTGERVAFFGRCETHSLNQQWRFIKV